MAILYSFVAALALLASVSQAAPAPDPGSLVQPRAACTNPALRKEWSAATPAERASYTKAVICLTKKPSRIGLKSNLYNDFPWVHNQLALRIHGVAQFLPWHRYFLHVYEAALQQCGYTGVMMYWNWVADSAAPASAKIWSLTDGFGGNGTNAATTSYNRCISGPFANITLAYKGNDTISHCIEREFIDGHPEAGLQEMIGWQYNADVVAAVNSNVNYAGFHPALEGGPHGVVHAGIAGTDGDMGPYTSPNDPIFYMHHAQVDRLWWLWQQVNPANRTYDYAGLEYGNLPGTLATKMKMLGLAADKNVGDVMNTRGSELCYVY